ncbi:MAG: hypothetical protein ACT4OO_01040 [Nitrospiraceae bacterium]
MHDSQKNLVVGYHGQKTIQRMDGLSSGGDGKRGTAAQSDFCLSDSEIEVIGDWDNGRTFLTSFNHQSLNHESLH